MRILLALLPVLAPDAFDDAGSCIRVIIGTAPAFPCCAAAGSTLGIFIDLVSADLAASHGAQDDGTS